MERLKKLLYEFYEQDVFVMIGSSDAKIQMNIDSNNTTCILAVYLNEKYGVGIVWDTSFRRENKISFCSLNINKNWSELNLGTSDIKNKYKKIGNKKSSPYEKVLIIGKNAFFDNYQFLFDYMQFDENDENYPFDYVLEEQIYNKRRTKRTVSQWKRSRNFRENVLKAYEYECAVCRCNNERILEAAHDSLHRVCESNDDNPKYGICLCRNHHKMYDSDLIDFYEGKLIVLDQSVNNELGIKHCLTYYGSKLKERK